MDEAVFRALNLAGTGPLLDWLAVALDRVGASWLWLVPAVGVLIGARRPEARWRRIVALGVVAAAGFGWAVNEAIKGVVGRPRPPYILDGVRLIVDPHPSYAFPSGHAMVSFACAACLAVALRRVVARGVAAPVWLGPVALLFALLVALSRVYLGVHWPSDIAAGALLGAAVGWGAWMLIEAAFWPPVPPSMRQEIDNGKTRVIR